MIDHKTLFEALSCPVQFFQLVLPDFELSSSMRDTLVHLATSPEQFENIDLNHNVAVDLWVLWKMYTTYDRTHVILSDRADERCRVLHRVMEWSRQIEAHVPLLGVRRSNINLGHITFDNGSRLCIAPTSSNALRGQTVNVVVVRNYTERGRKIWSESKPNAWPVFYSVKTRVIEMEQA